MIVTFLLTGHKVKKIALFARIICIYQKKVAPLQSCPVGRTKINKTCPLQRTNIAIWRNCFNFKIVCWIVHHSDLKNVKKLQKPDKIFISDPNMLNALTETPAKVGTIRETFAVNQLSALHEVEYGRAQGDFRVDGRYVFEVGGEDKDYTQIADIPNSYILADNMEYATGHKLPLWLIGLLY